MPRPLAAVTAVGLVLSLLAGCGGDRPAAAPTPSAAPSADSPLAYGAGQGVPDRNWSGIARAPLSPRARAGTVWTGDEVLVFGGEAARCLLPPCDRAGLRPVADGAAYDPEQDSWRSIAPLPAAASGLTPVRIGRTVYTFSTGTAGVRAFLAYDIDDDIWRDLPAPPRTPTAHPRLSATPDGRIVSTAWSHEGTEQDVVYDVAAATWSLLPPDPLGKTYNRYTMGLPDGALVVVGSRPVANPEVAPPVYSAARLDPGATEWATLPNSAVSFDTQVWWAVGSQVVSAMGGGRLGGRDSAAVAGSYPYGGILDGPAGRWRPLPSPVPARAPREGALEWAEAAGAETVIAGDNALHVPTGTWTRLSVPPELDARILWPAVVWAGDRLFAWSGLREEAGQREPLATGWTWRADGLT